jgi:hypothetical protein
VKKLCSYLSRNIVTVKVCSRVINRRRRGVKATMASVGSQTHSRSAPHSLTLCRLNTPIILALCNLEVARRLVSAPTSIMLLRPLARYDEYNAHRTYVQVRAWDANIRCKQRFCSCLFAAEGERVSCVMEWSLGTGARSTGSLLRSSRPPLCRLVMYCCNGCIINAARDAKRELQRRKLAKRQN